MVHCFCYPLSHFWKGSQKVNKLLRENVSSEKRGRRSLANTEVPVSGRYRKFEGWEVHDKMWSIIHAQTPQKP